MGNNKEKIEENKVLYRQGRWSPKNEDVKRG